MALRIQAHNHDVWTIRSPDGGTSATFVPSMGGTLCSLLVPSPAGPRELIYLHPDFWKHPGDSEEGLLRIRTTA